MKNVRLFAVAAALGMFASTVAAAETTSKTTVKWTGADTIIKVDLGEEVVVPTLTATKTTTTTGEKCVNGTDANGDGYVDGAVYAIDPKVNKEAGWLYTNAKYWATNSVEKHTAMYYLGLGGGKVTGGRFLAPGAAENEGTFTYQGTHKNISEEELLAAAEKTGDIKIVYKTGKYSDEIDYILVAPTKVYDKAGDSLQKTVWHKLTPSSYKYDEDAVKMALVFLAEGNLDVFDAVDVNRTLTKNVELVEIAPAVKGTTYDYKAELNGIEKTIGSSISVETYKGEYVVKAVDDEQFLYNDGYMYESGEPVSKFAEDTDYLTEPGKIVYYTEANGDHKKGDYKDGGVPSNKLVLAKNAKYFNIIPGAKAYSSVGSKVNFSSEYYIGFKAVKDAAGNAQGYSTFDAIEVQADKDGNTKLITKDDLMVTSAKGLKNNDLIEKVIAATSGDLSVSTNATFATLETVPASVTKKYTVKGELDTEEDKDYAKDKAAFPLVVAKAGGAYKTAGGAEYALVSAANLTKDDTLMAVTAIKGKKIIVEAVGTVYSTEFGTETTKAADLVEGATYHYVTWEGKQVSVPATGDKFLTKGSDFVVDVNSETHEIYTAQTDVTKADTLYDTATGKYYSKDVLFQIAKSVKATDPSKNYIKAGAINVINVDDSKDKNYYREAAITPKKAEAGDVAGYFLFNTETGAFDFVEEEPKTGATKGGYVNGKEVKSIDEFTTSHKDGLYYVTSVENTSDKYVLYTGFNGLNIPASFNTAKGEAYIELADGTTLTTKAVELAVDKKITRWFPAFDTEEDLVAAVYKIAGLEKALEGTSEDKKVTTFKTWYDAAKKDYDAKKSMLGDEALPTSATAPVHNAEKCTYDSEAAPTVVNVTADASKVNTEVAGIYDITYTADVAEDAENRTATVKVVVAPKYVRTWGANGKVATLTSFYVSNPEAKYAEYKYDWTAKKVTVTYYNVDGSVSTTTVNNL